ncbi:MAG TPA: hypothetical protein PKD83_00320 [Ignavibacteria bacterium]|nr:hypothetical protein [Ignavibacteria bacterium]
MKKERYNHIYLYNIIKTHFGLDANNLSKVLTGGFFYEWGKYVVKFAEPSFVGYGHYFDLYATIKPFDQLRNDLTYTYSELSTKQSGELLYAGYVLSDKISYQFNKNFFFRVLLQYDLFSKYFSIDPLLSYKWNPFTILFLGSSHDVNELQDIFGNSRYQETNRVLYMKFQYLFSL